MRPANEVHRNFQPFYQSRNLFVTGTYPTRQHSSRMHTARCKPYVDLFQFQLPPLDVALGVSPPDVISRGWYPRGDGWVSQSCGYPRVYSTYSLRYVIYLPPLNRHIPVKNYLPETCLAGGKMTKL